MRKTLDRVGASMSAVALLAGGLVGVAAQAGAEEPEGGEAPQVPGYVTDTYFYGVDTSDDGAGNMPQRTLEELNKCTADPNWVDCVGTNGTTQGPSYDPDNSSVTFHVTGLVTGCKLFIYTCSRGDGGSFEGQALDPIPAPPPCWSGEAGNNCPVGGAIQVALPQYMIAGVPQQLVVYAAWRPDANTAGAPTNGDAVISMDGEPIAAAPFADGKATFNFTPTEPGLKNVVISGVLNSNTSGANAWIDSVEVSTMVLEWDPEALEEALKNKKVEVGDTYTLEEVAQAKTALGKRLEWRVAQDSKDVCAVTTTKKGEVRAKFTESGKCSIIWTDPKKDEEGKYTFIAKK